MKILKKIKTIIKIIRIYKTWPLAFLEYFRLLKNKEVIHILRNNTKYIIRTNAFDSDLVNEMYLGQLHDRLLKNKIKNNSVIIDIGAHIGTFSVLIAKLAKDGKVYCFEPMIENYSMLKRNIALNNLKNVIAFNLGIGGKKGPRTLFLNETNSGGHSIYGKTSKSIEINLITLKDVFEKNKIIACDFMKVDCEGAEYEIILNTPKYILKKIANISIELHSAKTFERRKAKKVENYLKKCGFKTEIDEKTSMLFAEK